MSVFYTVISVCFFIMWALSLIVDGDVRTDVSPSKMIVHCPCDKLCKWYKDSLKK